MAENSYIQTGSQAGKEEQTQVEPLCPARPLKKGRRSLSLSLPSAPFCTLSGPSPPKRTSPAWCAWLCSLLSHWCSFLAAQQPKSVKTDLPCSSNLIGVSVLFFSPWCSVFATEPPKSSKTDLASWVCLVVLLALPLVVCFGRSAAQILQNGLRHVGQLGCAPCSPSGGLFWPLSSPNPPRWTSCLLLICFPVFALPLVFPFDRSAARINQSGPPYLMRA